MEKPFKISDKYFLFFIIIFGILFFFELTQYYQLTNFYPLKMATDLNTYIIRLNFLKEYGFHNLVPNVAGGILLYYDYPIGWGFFNLPIYLLTNNILLTTFLSTIIIFILSFIVFYFIGKIENFSFLRVTTFFLLFFANPLMLVSIFHVGRASELLGWLVLNLFFLYILIYKNKKINTKEVLIFILIYAVLLLTHIYSFLIGSVLLLGLFLIKSFKEKLKIILIGIITLLITSFWWIYFSKYTSRVVDAWSIKGEILSTGIFSRHIWFSYSTLSLILFFGVFYLFYLYIKNEFDKDNFKKEILFYLPVLSLAGLILTKLIIFIPIFSSIPFSVYSEFFIFISIFLFLKIKKFYLPKNIKKYFILILILAPFIFSGFFVYNYHNGELFYDHGYKYTQQDENVIDLMKNIEGNFVFLTETLDMPSGIRTLHIDWPYTDYAIIYYNKSSISDTYSWYLVNPKIADDVQEVYKFYNKNDCSSLLKKMNEMEYGSIMSYDPYCENLRKCGLNESKRIGVACLFYL